MSEAENCQKAIRKELKTWGTLQDRTKSIWNDLAKQGCPAIPDPHQYKGE